MAGLFGYKQNPRTADMFANMSAGQRFGEAVGNARNADIARKRQGMLDARQFEMDDMTMKYRQSMIDMNNRPAKPIETFTTQIDPDTGRSYQISSISGKRNYDPALPNTPNRPTAKGRDGRLVYTDEQGGYVNPNVGLAPVPATKKPYSRSLPIEDGGVQYQELNADGEYVNVGEAKYDKPNLNEGNAYGFANRIAEGIKGLASIDPTGTVASDWASNKTAELPGGNMLVSGEFQQVTQIKRDLTNAILRRESGAAIGKDEFDNANLQYFPVPGDKPETIKLKRRNLISTYKAMIAGAGRLGNDLPSADDLSKLFDKLEDVAKKEEVEYTPEQNSLFEKFPFLRGKI
tara:strand:- start:3694 stop:4734 length:1041 start_codon:yes stop_codon:yes gene_type:complete